MGSHFTNSNSTRNQVDEEPLCGCATRKSLIILFILFIYFMATLLSPPKHINSDWVRVCQYDVTSRVSDFQSGELSKRRIKISNLSRKYCSNFLDLEILRSLLS